MSHLLRPLLRQKSGAPKAARPAPRDPVAVLFSEAVPLVGPDRVPKQRDGKGSSPRNVRHAPRAAQIHFTVRRDGDSVEGFRDDLGEAAVVPLRRPDWAPEQRLDLHGRRARGVTEALHRFVSACAARGVRRILVIHGKGLHSKGGTGVMAELARDALMDATVAAVVRAFRSARATHGGAGALAVELDAAKRTLPTPPAATDDRRGGTSR